MNLGFKYIKIHNILLLIAGTTSYFNEDENFYEEFLFKSGFSTNVIFTLSLIV